MIDPHAEGIDEQGRGECTNRPSQSRAEQLLYEVFEKQETVDIDALCRQHPDLADHLRSLFTAWSAVEHVLSDERLLDRLVSESASNAPEQAGFAAEIEASANATSRPGAPPAHRYRLTGRVGRGGMGMVVEVRDMVLGRDLAMKILLGYGDRSRSGPELSPGRSQIDRFCREARITSQLDHPGIVPVHDLGIDARGRVYFTMRLVKGVTLKEILSRVEDNDPDWSVPRVLNVMLRACEAVAYAHAKGVIHRDIKPANIMVGRFGEVYVMDWGLAKFAGRDDGPELSPPSPSGAEEVIADSKGVGEGTWPDYDFVTRDGVVMGTPTYMPPEQARGAIERMGPPADVYAMGAVLYHLLSGHPPYVPAGTRTTAARILEQVVNGPPAPLRTARHDIPPELCAVCEKAMERSPAQRYPSMRELAGDLRAFTERRVVAAYRTGPLIELRKWIDRNRGMAGAIATAVLVALISLGTIALLQTRARSRERLAKISAETNLQEYRRMTDVKKAQELIAEAQESLWPRRPEKIPEMERWLVAADGLRERFDQHRRVLDALSSRARIMETPIADRGPALDHAALGRTDKTELTWKLDVMRELVSNLEIICRPGTGLIDDVEERLAFAREIRGSTIDAFREEWSEAIAAIAADPKYNSLALEPQVGLIPLGPDPHSGLWEFWHLESGARPKRRESDGRLTVTDETGIILVLIPGGTATIGVQTDDPNLSNYDVEANPNEAIASVTLAPFLLSKYEMTQGQWLRTGRTNTSRYRPGHPWSDEHFDLSHPVETIDWATARRACRQMGLDLPTEAQWESACRAGTQTVFSTGNDVMSLSGYANIADQGSKDKWLKGWPYEPGLSDGFAFHAPVGTFLPNAFGLLDMHGNVHEWCRDIYVGSYAGLERNPGDGLLKTQPQPTSERVLRGGSFANMATYTRCARRLFEPPELRDGTIGLRPACRVRGR